MLDELQKLSDQFDSELTGATTAAAADELRVRYFGRKGGLIPALFGRLKEVPPDQKREVGDALNRLRDRIETQLKSCLEELTARDAAAKEARSSIDVTLPGRVPS